MGVLRVLCTSGDAKVEWDLDEEEAVREAERIFQKNAAKGYASFEVGDGVETARRIARFEPRAKVILQIPPIVGG